MIICKKMANFGSHHGIRVTQVIIVLNIKVQMFYHLKQVYTVSLSASAAWVSVSLKGF